MLRLHIIPKDQALRILVLLTMLGMSLQVIPFSFEVAAHTSTLGVLNPTLSSDLPLGYSLEDYVKAEQFNRPFVFGLLLSWITQILGLSALIVSRSGYRFEDTFSTSRWRWPARFFFFFLISFGLNAVTIPYQVAGYFHARAFGLSAVMFSDWLKIHAVHQLVPTGLFVFHCVIVYCFMHLFRRHWWVTAAFFLFALGTIPEFIKIRPIELVAELTPLEEGAYRTELERTGRVAGIELEMFVEDRSARAATANLYLGGRAADRFVVVTDTFMESFTPREAASALAHELGHIENEVPALVVHKALTIITLLAGFLAAFVMTGRKEITSRGCMQAVIITFLCLICAGYLFKPARNAIARWEEQKADTYGLTLTHDAESFTSLLVKSARTNLVQLKLPPWKYYLFSQYPDLQERIDQAHHVVPSLRD